MADNTDLTIEVKDLFDSHLIPINQLDVVSAKYTQGIGDGEWYEIEVQTKSRNKITLKFHDKRGEREAVYSKLKLAMQIKG